MFSVLGEREISGRTGTILEGESGANDPVGIALMLGMIELATHADASFWIVVRVFAEQMSIGLAIGIAGGLVERVLMQRVALPSAGLYTLAHARARRDSSTASRRWRTARGSSPCSSPA